MVRTASGSVRVNFHIPPAVLDALKFIAKRRGSTYSELIRIACREYAVREAQKIQAEHIALATPQETT